MSKVGRSLIGWSKRNSESSVIKIADIATKLGIQITTAGSPVADALWEVSKAGIAKVRDYIYERDDRRIYEFHHKLLINNDSIDEDIMRGGMEEANFHALLQACLSDIEDEKTVPYALLARAIILGKVKQEVKRHFIISLKELAWDHLDFIRRAYVLTKHSIIPAEGPGSIQPESILTGYAPGSLEHLAVAALTSRGFVDSIKLSELGLTFVESCSDTDDLTPANYEYQVWSGHKCEIIDLQDLKPSAVLSQAVARKLRSIGVESGAIAMQGSLRRSEANLYSNCVIVIYPIDKQLDAQELKNLERRAGKKVLVQAIVTNENEAVSTPLLPGAAIGITGEKIDLDTESIVKELVRKVNERERERKEHKDPE